MRHAISFILSLFLAAALSAEDLDAHSPYGDGYQFKGLSVFVDAGVARVSNVHANFYNGSLTNANTINRVMHSEGYGQQMWDDLVSQSLISPSAIQNFRQLEVVEYADMFYKIAYQIGFGFRYDYDSGLGWLLRFDLIELNSIGAFNLSSRNGTGILTNQNQYVRCGIMGQEKRINIDFALTHRFNRRGLFEWEVDFGCNVNNTSVLGNDIEVAGRLYNILNVWGDMGPGYFNESMNYINQGGIGVGGFATISACYKLMGSAISMGYTFYYTKINLEGYSAYAPQHNIFLRFDLNKFSFLD